jgi:hypothetical protein
VGLTLPEPRRLGRYFIEGIQVPSLPGVRASMRALIRDGVSGTRLSRAVLKSEWVDELYREGDPAYSRFADALVARLRSFDVVVFSTYCPLHPEILVSELRGATRVLGFSDDPHSTYVRGIPYLWAFDAAYYISPSYSGSMSFAELFGRVGFTKVRWMPLVLPRDYPVLDAEQIRNRSRTCCYVGNPTGSKFDRIRALKRRFGSEFEVYGRWPLHGYYGFVRPLIGESSFLRPVRSISAVEKETLYLSTKIGFNMHVSDRPAECGNMRTYEAAGFGMMSLCDRGALNLQSTIFEEGREAIYYSDLQEACALIEEFSRDDGKRTSIAQLAHRRFHSDYTWNKVWREFLDWL